MYGIWDNLSPIAAARYGHAALGVSPGIFLSDLARLPTSPSVPAPLCTVTELLSSHQSLGPSDGTFLCLDPGPTSEGPSPGLVIHMGTVQQHRVPQGSGSTCPSLSQPRALHMSLAATVPLPSPSLPCFPTGCSEHADQVPVPGVPGTRHPLRRSPPWLGENGHGGPRITNSKKAFG